MDYSNIQKQAKSGFASPNIIDFNGNEWRMEIKFDRDDFNKILLSAHIFASRITTARYGFKIHLYYLN